MTLVERFVAEFVSFFLFKFPTSFYDARHILVCRDSTAWHQPPPFSSPTVLRCLNVSKRFIWCAHPPPTIAKKQCFVFLPAQVSTDWSSLLLNQINKSIVKMANGTSGDAYSLVNSSMDGWAARPTTELFSVNHGSAGCTVVEVAFRILLPASFDFAVAIQSRALQTALTFCPALCSLKQSIL